MKRAIIIGASSGIGRSLALELSKQGYSIGITGRRTHLLEKLANEISSPVYVATMDVIKTEDAINQLQDLISKMGGLDLLILNAGIGNSNKEYLWELEKQTVDVNVRGFVALANAGFHYFRHSGTGHIVGISSVASHFSIGRATAYNASKAFISNYLKGLRYKAFKFHSNIFITDIKPGFVYTPMIKNNKGTFWVISSDKAARLIYKAVKKKKRDVYIPFRWRLLSWILPMIPEFIYKRI